MRRKSSRNAQKGTPEPPKETEAPLKTRRSRRRKRSPSKSSGSEEEIVAVTKRQPPEETPDTTTKSHTPTDEETSEEPVWKVTSSDDLSKGEIHKLKICLTRPAPDSPEKNRSRRSKSGSQTEDDATSSEDKSSTRRTRSRGSPFVRNDGLSSREGDDEVEEKIGKGKSKGKHKSKTDKSPHLSEPEIQPNNEISENAQVTPQSPSIDKPVDNESDYNKVDDDDIQNINASIQKRGNVDEESAGDTVLNCDDNQVNLDANSVTDLQDSNKESDDDEPLSVVQGIAINEKEKTELDHPESAVQGPNEIAQQSEQENIETSQHEEPQVQVTDANEEAAKPEQYRELEVTVSHDTHSTSEQSLLMEPEEVVENLQEEVFPTSQDVPETELGEYVIEEVVSSEDALVSLDDKETSTSENIAESNVQSEVLLQQETVSTDQTTVEDTHQSVEEQRSRRRLRRTNNLIDSIGKESGDNTKESCCIKPASSIRKWEQSSNVSSSFIKIDLESLQTVWPSIEFPEEPDLNMDYERERRRSVAEPTGEKLERKVSVEYKSDSSERPSFEKQSSTSSVTQDSEDNSNIIAFNRKISIVDDTASKLKPPPSPAKNPISDILYITNLVRPFTLKQLKELLERTGKIPEEGFWTDRIKSKCYVHYETQEEAEATRNALHGVQWPIGNGKKLMIEYATEDDMYKAKNPPAPPPVVAVPETKASIKENMEPVENKPRHEEKFAKEGEKKRNQGPVREWDIGKRDVRKDRSRSRERGRKHRRSGTPPDDFITRKQQKVEESVPQKLMDDLFLKTKATPSIYWQPLSPEEISMKQQQRLIRMEEHKRRMEENSRLKGRDLGRGAFRRRYD